MEHRQFVTFWSSALLGVILVCLISTPSNSQDVVTSTVCTSVEKADVVFVLDSSGSINDTKSSQGLYNNWPLALDSLIKIMDEVNVGLEGWRFGLVIFSAEAYNVFYLRDSYSRDHVAAMIRGARYLGEDTNMADALKLAREEQFTEYNGDRQDVPNIIIIVTDGNSTVNKDRTIPEAMWAHHVGIGTFSVGVTTRIHEEELKALSSPPHIQNQNWFRSTTFHFEEQVIGQITRETCKHIEQIISTPLPTISSTSRSTTSRPTTSLPTKAPPLQPVVDCECPLVEDEWRLYAIIAFIAAGVCFLGLIIFGIIAVSMSSKASSLRNKLRKLRRET